MHVGKVRLPSGKEKIFFCCDRCTERFDSKAECSKHEAEKLCRCKLCYRKRKRCKEDCIYKSKN